MAPWPAGWRPAARGCSATTSRRSTRTAAGPCSTPSLATLGQPGRPERPLQAVSGLDAGPVVELAFPDDQAPTTFTLDDGTVVLLNLGEEPVEVDGPGGVNLLTGESGEAGPRTLAAGDGEVWVP